MYMYIHTYIPRTPYNDHTYHTKKMQKLGSLNVRTNAYSNLASPPPLPGGVVGDGGGGTCRGQLLERGSGGGELTVCRGVDDVGVTGGRGGGGGGKQGDSDAGGAIVCVCVCECVCARVLVCIAHNGLTHI
jgi:hypothetical protein